ncbi:hypothetical protein ACFQS1_37530 [Paractinoplanes rhizophilus]|uniref:DUF1508 domain-containing protein n=1 Tax=Paractinoplanes rhizophilus TaxID=1416877 RepID=A0ABW2I4C0_9ACTN
MDEFQFEIFLRDVDRYEWRLVQHDGQRRVLARSLGDFATPLLAQNSIMVMKQIVERAPIVTVGDGYGQPVGFEIVDAFPLRLSGSVSHPAVTEDAATALRRAEAAPESASERPAGARSERTAEPARARKAATATRRGDTAETDAKSQESDETTGARTDRDGPHASGTRATKPRKTARAART